MREHWQPSSFDRLGQGSQARALMAAQARAAWLTAELPPSAPPIPRQPHRSLRIVSASLSVATSLALAACGPTPKPSPEVQQPPSSPAVATTVAPASEISFGYPFSGLWYLTAGPHSDGLTGGVRAALDFAPPEVVACPGGKPVWNRYVEPSAPGIVAIVGKRNDPTDQNHSIVEIDHGQGLRTGYVHLDNILASVGERVTPGYRLGNPSCEIPPGGASSGSHLHWYVKKDGKFISADGIKFLQGQIKAGPNNKDGTLIGPDNVVRTADERRCGPNESSIKVCDGKRNDLNTGAVLGESVKVAPLPTVAAAKPAQKSPELSLPADLPTFSSLRFPYQFKAPQGWINGPYHQGPSTDVYMGIEGKPATLLMITFASARSDVKLEALKNQIIGPGDSRTEVLPGKRGVMVIKFQEKYINGLDAWEKITFDLKEVTRDIVFVRPGETWIIQFMLQGDWTQLMPNDRIQFLGEEKIKTVIRTFTLSRSK